MNLQIKRIHPESLALTTGVITLAFSLAQSAKELVLAPSGETKDTFSLLTASLLAAALGAIHGLVIALIYNLYTKFFHGITVETKPQSPLPNQSLE